MAFYEARDSFWARNFCKGGEECEQVGWTEFRDGLVHELQIPEEQLEKFNPIFAREVGVGAKVPFVTKDRFNQLVLQYGHFFDPDCGKEFLEQVTFLHEQLWFYDSMNLEEAYSHLCNYSKQTFLVKNGKDCFVVISRNGFKNIGRSYLELGRVIESCSSTVACVESLPPQYLTYVCRTTGCIKQLPIKHAWKKYIKKSELWKNCQQLSKIAEVSELSLQISNMPGRIIAEVIKALAEIANLASVVTDCELPRKVYRHVMSAWLRAALYQVVNASCAVFNFETMLDDHLVTILPWATQVINKILSNNTSNLEGLCSKIAEEVKQAIGQVAIIELKFDGIIKLIQELLDTIETGVLNEKDRLQVTSAMTTCLTAVTRVKHQWRITGDWLEVLKGDTAILLAQHELLEIDNTIDLAFFMNRSNAAILSIALCHRLSWDHLFLSLPLLDDMLDLSSDSATLPRLENEVKEKMSYFDSEIETLINNITHEIRETFVIV